MARRQSLASEFSRQHLQLQQITSTLQLRSGSSSNNNRSKRRSSSVLPNDAAVELLQARSRNFPSLSPGSSSTSLVSNPPPHRGRRSSINPVGEREWLPDRWERPSKVSYTRRASLQQAHLLPKELPKHLPRGRLDRLEKNDKGGEQEERSDNNSSAAAATTTAAIKTNNNNNHDDGNNNNRTKVIITQITTKTSPISSSHSEKCDDTFELESSSLPSIDHLSKVSNSTESSPKRPQSLQFLNRESPSIESLMVSDLRKDSSMSSLLNNCPLFPRLV